MQVVLIKRKHEVLNTLDKKDARDRASEILTVAQQSHFWSDLETMVQNLLPPRISVKNLEADSARLDQRFFQPADNAELDQTFQQMANYIAKTDSFSASLPRNAFVHERLQEFAKVRSMLPPKPKQEKAKRAANQYSGVHSATQQAAAKAEAACAEAAQATKDMADQFVDGEEDLLVFEQQVADVAQELTEQVDEDAADDQEYHACFDRITLGNMFLFNTLPAFNLEMLFEDDIVTGNRHYILALRRMYT
ncbi:hypothetical protein ABBQ32_004459 [Trebouxia sp. C0010 RCD-2024]